MFRNPKINRTLFLNYQYQTIKSKRKINNITTGNTIKHILASDMYNFIVDVSDIEEQNKLLIIFGVRSPHHSSPAKGGANEEFKEIYASKYVSSRKIRFL